MFCSICRYKIIQLIIFNLHRTLREEDKRCLRENVREESNLNRCCKLNTKNSMQQKCLLFRNYYIVTIEMNLSHSKEYSKMVKSIVLFHVIIGGKQFMARKNNPYNSLQQSINSEFVLIEGTVVHMSVVIFTIQTVFYVLFYRCWNITKDRTSWGRSTKYDLHKNII